MIQLQEDEKMITEVRRHWYILLIDSLFLIVLAVIPFVALLVINNSALLANPQFIALFVFASAAWFLILWMTFATMWTNYYLDVWIITDKRIIDIEQHYLFSREVSEFKLDKIQDVTIEVKGFFPTLLHFGDLYVQTAGQARQFIIRSVPHPEKVKEIIFRQHDALFKRKSA